MNLRIIFVQKQTLYGIMKIGFLYTLIVNAGEIHGVKYFSKAKGEEKCLMLR